MIGFDCEKALANHGDITRLSKVYKKLEKGEEVTICFLGGSITQGSLSSAPDTCYAALVYKWFKTFFGKENIKYINAGVGGTTSVFGAARADRDVLLHAPDLVFVEFSVNDECTDYFFESYEGLIRKLLGGKNKPAVVTIFNCFYENGKTAERLHSKVARHYGLPAVSLHGAIYDDILAGKIEDIALLSPDGLHPNDTGHELISRMVSGLLESLYEDYKKAAEVAADTALSLPKPLTLNGFESAKRLDNRDFEPKLSGFVKDEAIQECVSDCFKNGWLGKKAGDKIFFDLKDENECASIALQYDKTIKRPAPVVAVAIDGKKDEQIIIDAAFDETWGDLLDIRQLFFDREKAPHRLEIEVIDDKNGEAVPFNLVSVIITK